MWSRAMPTSRPNRIDMKCGVEPAPALPHWANAGLDLHHAMKLGTSAMAAGTLGPAASQVHHDLLSQARSAARQHGVPVQVEDVLVFAYDGGNEQLGLAQRAVQVVLSVQLMVWQEKLRHEAVVSPGHLKVQMRRPVQ